MTRTIPKKMTTGSPLGRIAAFCVPLLIGNLFQQFYNLADSFLVGRCLGMNAFAAVGSTAAVNFLILGFATGICSGFTIPIAQSYGARRMDRVARQAGQLLWLGTAFAALITLLAWAWTDDLLLLIRTPAEIFDQAYRYIFLVLAGAGATMLYNLCSAVLRALGDSRTPLFFLVGAVVINVALDILFMGAAGMDVEGAALATVLSQLIAGLACLGHIYLRVPALRLGLCDVVPDRKLMGIMLRVGLPMGLQFSITAVGTILIQSAVNSLGAGAVAAFSAASKVNTLMGAPLESCGIAMATYCGQNLGARELGRVRRGIRAAMGMCLVYCAAACVCNVFWGTGLAGLFLNGAGEEILANVRRYLVTMGAAYPMLAVIHVFRNALQGMGFSRQAMGAGLAELTGRALVTFTLVGALGFRAVCLGNPAAWLLADALLLTLYWVEMKRLEGRFSGSELRLSRAAAK